MKKDNDVKLDLHNRKQSSLSLLFAASVFGTVAYVVLTYQRAANAPLSESEESDDDYLTKVQNKVIAKSQQNLLSYLIEVESGRQALNVH